MIFIYQAVYCKLQGAIMKLKALTLVIAGAALSMQSVVADATKTDAPVYADFPVTLQGYSGDAETSVAYTGQIARYVLHDSLKKLAGSDNDKSAEALKALMTAYFSEKKAGRDIIVPTSSKDFPIMQSKVDDLSTDKNLAGKTYAGVVNGWPGHMTGAEVISFMIDKAAASEGGYDVLNGYDYAQLISKTLIGAVFYNQAVDNYLDEKLAADVKPNDKPYGEGDAYTGKEHSWDEGFGYFGAPAHVMSLDPATVYSIAKTNPEVFKQADANGDGKIDLLSEMTFANAYYAANADKGGNTTYLHDISRAFIDGRQLIADAKGKKLTVEQLDQLQAYATEIKTQWEQVLAEAAYKYAGAVYQDLQKLQTIVESDGDIASAYRDYAKHWGELKGFSLSLQMGGKDMAGTAVQINRLIGFSPVDLAGEQVTGIEDGEYVRDKTMDMGEYMVNMIKLQNLLDDSFKLQAKQSEISTDVEALSKKLGEKRSAEND